MKWLEVLQARWQAWWPELAPREQRLVAIAAALVGLALVWWVALAPALGTLSAAPAEHAKLDAQLQQMTALQRQAKSLQSQPRASRDDALRALEASVRENLGPNAQLQTAGAGENATIALRAAPADALAQLITQARSNARAVPREVHLTRSSTSQAGPGGPGAAPAAPAAPAEPPRPRWDGTLVMGLPAR
ncbi:type II secretion system protein GspM [Variovorax ginsengisoli]|uniref:Type II secretion system protein GspM n=1 Tax=Variovorax ginsengisoli TaxID=363844 RepID=A0ABT8RYD4_9BURK|nr:type II secretion system protein GspM [Variovorax ginsengisoli]MDN8611862.1 type II secretion system protein GspM [Variovorax ginsengisoli]MDO1531032.1 type II secretion system protein GspM [Variovorax ginsengisoli]